MAAPTDLSPLAPAVIPDPAPLDGVQIATCASALKYRGRDDLMTMLWPESSAVAVWTTRNQCRAAPVLWCERIAARRDLRGLVINAGNANAATGRQGLAIAEETADAFARLHDLDAEQILVGSTGVIGEPIPSGHLPAGIKAAKSASFLTAANAIRTLDTFPKVVERQVGDARVVGIAKGAGMIAPNMATMLSVVVTDAALDPDTLKHRLTPAVDDSFNSITVDGDTSTNDMVVLVATGRVAADRGSVDAAIADVMDELAEQMVRDGEGVGRMATLRVVGAPDRGQAEAVARTIADSPLVKTALAGGDPNWGRIMMAIGNAGVAVDPSRIGIWIGGRTVALNGERAPDYDEDRLAAEMAQPNVPITVDLGVGLGSCRMRMADLTGNYVRINADYRS